jgi:hypothetical protein
LLGGAAWPLAARAQQPRSGQHVPHVGILNYAMAQDSHGASAAAGAHAAHRLSVHCPRERGLTMCWDTAAPVLGLIAGRRL